MLNMGFLLVQEKAQDKLNFLQMSPCWPCLISNFSALFSAVHLSQKSHFHVTSAGWISTFLSGNLTAPPIGLGFSSDAVSLSSAEVFSIESTAFPYPSSIPNPPSLPCKVVWGGGSRGDFMITPPVAGVGSPLFFFLLSSPKGQPLILRDTVVSTLEEAAQYFPQHLWFARSLLQ